MDRKRTPDRRVLQKLAGALLFFWVPGVTAGLAWANEPALDSEPTFKVHVQDNMVTLTARNVRLEEVLGEIARQSRFDFKSKGGLDRLIVWSLIDTPVEIAIARLLRYESSVMIYGVEESGSKQHLKAVLAWGRRVGDASGHSYKQAADPEEPVWEARQYGRGFWTTPRIEAHLEDLLPDESDKVRERLTDLPEFPTADDLDQLLSRDEDPAVRAVAVIALSRLRDETAKEALVAALSDDDRQVRLLAVQGLAISWGEEALEPLRMALMEDPAPLVRSNAAMSIARLSKDNALAALREAQFDEDASVQEVVAHALERLDAQ